MRWFWVLLMIPHFAFAECNWAADVFPNGHGSFDYSEGCHLAVGQMKQDLLISNEKVKDLDRALALKALTLEVADERADHLMDVSTQLNEKLQTVERYQKQNAWLCFGAGVLTMFAVGSLINTHIR